MTQVTVEEMETQTNQIMRAVREEQIAFEVTENGRPVAVLSPASADNPKSRSGPSAGAIALVEAWLAEDDNESEGSLAEFLTFIEENRLDLSAES